MAVKPVYPTKDGVLYKDPAADPPVVTEAWLLEGPNAKADVTADVECEYVGNLLLVTSPFGYPVAGRLDTGSDQNDTRELLFYVSWTEINGSASSDPLSASVPGFYSPGQAGYQLGRIGSANATIAQPWSSTDQLQLKQGDDYSISEGRQIPKTFSNCPDISTASVKFKAKFNDKSTFQKAMTVTGASAAYLELTSAETKSFATGLSYFDIEITYANGHVVTPVDNGELFVTADI